MRFATKGRFQSFYFSCFYGLYYINIWMNILLHKYNIEISGFYIMDLLSSELILCLRASRLLIKLQIISN